MIFNRSQFGHHWWPYKYLACIQFPPTHKKALCHDCFNSCSNSVFQVLQIYYFLVHIAFFLYPQKKIKNSEIWAAVTAHLPNVFPLTTLPVSLNCFNHWWTLFTCGDFLLNSFLNFQWTLINNFDSANHKTHCTFSTSVNIINSKHLRQRQTDRKTDTLRPCDPEWALGADTCCAKKLCDGISVATFTVLYHRSPILLMFNILPFFYENPLLVPQSHFKS